MSYNYSIEGKRERESEMRMTREKRYKKEGEERERIFN